MDHLLLTFVVPYKTPKLFRLQQFSNFPQGPEDLKSYFELIRFVEDRPGHDYRYAIDCSKINEDLNWEPKINFENGIRKTITWYLENKDWMNQIKKENHTLSKMDKK